MDSSTTKTNELVSKEANSLSTGQDTPTTMDSFLVTLEPHEDPQCLPTLAKWTAILVISSASLCVTCFSSIASSTEAGIAAEFHVAKEVSILGISMFVLGLGLGPLVVGPLSELYGRIIVYRYSYLFFFLFSFPIAFAPNIEVYLLFRFATGLCGAAFLSVAGGSVSDMFSNAAVANPMAIYTLCPFIGPIVGPLLGGFINQHPSNWRWTFRLQIIWTFFELIAIVLFLPETDVPVLLKWKAQRLRQSTGNSSYYAPLDRRNMTLMRSIVVGCYTPFQLMFFDRMVLILNLWDALLLGILYLTFQAFPIIFEQHHGFSTGETGMSFLGIGLGMIIAVATEPFWNILFAHEEKKYNGHPPPETRLYMGQVGGILVPIGLVWLAFTTYARVPWIVPIIASVPFGMGILFVFTSTFTYQVTAYRPIAASAMASNSALRFTFAAAFPLFAGSMYDKLGTVGATGLLAGITAIMAPLPFILYRIGPKLRQSSRFAVKD
ncbi:MFS general substrate transporter [Athelia psychrophila]|uniref:MFS general substrate transporter n=1 Tax=Athelia psychrophila TaxID=1759441 RepID=A0A166SNB9_9AGAM|nr:MFS general substrate transporter [Fibularhizoctonia sp. CBS 109695]